ncbi:hypothetical protein HA402_008363 [Bradysia odoriphaga]|nr:hypothetical protein HA402_008363 [Bradysia odoriphaga]
MNKQGAPGQTTAEQRRTAETIIMNFRKTKSPYQLCQEILEKTRVDILRFEAADMIKSAIVAEWDTLEDQYKLSLRQYLLNYILNQNVQPFVREKILQVVGIMIKRSSILDAGVERGFILDEAQKMISSGDISQQYLACRIVYNIMQEYSTTIKSVSDDTGLTFNEHFKAKKQFELLDLRKIFVMIFDALVAIMKIIDLTNATHVHLLLEYFTIHEQILMWGYVSPLLSKRLVSIFESINKTDQCPSLRLTLPWERIILDPRVVEVFFGIYWKVREIPQIQPKSLTCIVQLSTLNGPVLNNQENKLKYVTNFLTNFLQLTSSIQTKSTEANGFATVLRRILLYNLPNIFKDISDELRTSLLQQMFVLTCHFMESSIHEEDMDCLAEPVYTEALDIILEAWLLIIQGKEHFQADLLKQYSIQVFNKYLQCHLAPPDGLRKASLNTSRDMDDELEQKDRDRYKEQLIIIGALGREEPSHALPILCKLLEEKTRCLQAHLERVYTNAVNLNVDSSEGVEQLYDDILWIILVSAHVMSMESVGEQPIIPSEIMHSSKQQMLNGQTDLTASLKVLALEAPVGDDTLCDHCTATDCSSVSAV